MRSSLSGGIALFPTILGQSVTLKTASPNLSSGNEKGKYQCSSYQHKMFALSQFKQDLMYRHDLFNIVFPPVMLGHSTL